MKTSKEIHFAAVEDFFFSVKGFLLVINVLVSFSLEALTRGNSLIVLVNFLVYNKQQDAYYNT